MSTETAQGTRVVERELGDEALVKQLYSYPNLKKGGEGPLEKTVQHYIDQSLRREGLEAEGVRAEVTARDGRYTLRLLGSASREGELRTFTDRLGAMLEHATHALAIMETIERRPPRTRADEKKPWDPFPEKTWRPFFGHGLPMVRQRAVQFFHYPPLRLLDPLRDYLNDPVPRQIEQMLLANIGWEELLRYGELEPDEREREHRLALYERVVDGCPIAAPDAHGSAPVAGIPGARGYMPMDDFPDYQKAELQLFTQDHPGYPGHTIPVVAFGGEATPALGRLFGAHGADPGGPETPKGSSTPPRAGHVSIRPGKQTPFLTVGHPYALFMILQGGPAGIEKGRLASPANAEVWEASARNNLAVAGWTLAMWEDPGQDPIARLRERKEHWSKQKQRVQALIRHLGSYWAGEDLSYGFRETLEQAERYVHDHPGAPYGG